MTLGVSIKKHIILQRDTITPKDRRKKPYKTREYVLIDGHKYWYYSTFLSSSAAEDVAEKEYPGREWIIIPYGGYGNPALPGLFIAEA
jgi:hypothetical protein